MQFIRSHVTPADLILTDKARSFQLEHYLCRQKGVPVEAQPDGSERFRREEFQVLSTGAGLGALTAARVDTMSHEHPGPRAGASRVWVVQGGWACGSGEALRSRAVEFSAVEIESFGRYFEIFQIPPPARPDIPVQQAR